MKIVPFTNKLWTSIIAFNKKSFPLRKGVEASFEDRFFKNPYSDSSAKSKFIVADDTEVLGQFLVMSTRFHYLDATYDGVWGMDFFIDEKLRGQKKGHLLAAPAISETNYCVMGLSQASEALHQKYGCKELAKAVRFIRPTGWSSLASFLFYNNNFKREEVNYPSRLSIKKQIISRVFTSDQLPDQAYWSVKTLEWDRSKAFLEWRFFTYQNKYAVYWSQDQSFYFVVRKIRWRNINCLLLVDYRYRDAEDFQSIYQLSLKIAAKIKAVAVIALSSIESEQDYLKANFNKRFAEPIPVMTTTAEVFSAKQVLVTPADSDFDTFYGDNVW